MLQPPSPSQLNSSADSANCSACPASPSGRPFLDVAYRWAAFSDAKLMWPLACSSAFEWCGAQLAALRPETLWMWCRWGSCSGSEHDAMLQLPGHQAVCSLGLCLQAPSALSCLLPVCTGLLPSPHEVQQQLRTKCRIRMLLTFLFLLLWRPCLAANARVHLTYRGRTAQQMDPPSFNLLPSLSGFVL